MADKGGKFEEEVRRYFAQRGFYALRGVMFRYGAHDVTDIDVWLYGKQASGIRVRAIADVKSGKSPRAFERILWVRGLQHLTGADRSFVATPDRNPDVSTFGEQHGILVITKDVIAESASPDNDGRLTYEEFNELIRQYGAQKQDGDWLKTLDEVRSSVVSLEPFRAFNMSLAGFRFFAERAETRPLYKEQALRSALICASVAAVAMDRALEPLQFRNQKARASAILNGVAFGDSGDGKVRRNLESLLDVISDHIANGKTVSAQVKLFFEKLPVKLRADVLAEHFAQDIRAQKLLAVARELDHFAFRKGVVAANDISLECRSAIGVFADYAGIDRKGILPLLTSTATSTAPPDSGAEPNETISGPPGSLL